jgi:hypothetical protein
MNIVPKVSSRSCCSPFVSGRAEFSKDFLPVQSENITLFARTTGFTCNI